MEKGIISLNSSFECFGNAVGNKEFEGPLGNCFDYHDVDNYFGQKTWEKAESEMQRLALNITLNKGNLEYKDIGALFAGDLLNQCVASSYGLAECKIPFFGIYGACSTSAEGIVLASIMTTHKIFKRCIAITSSHNCTAERQFRTPIEYGGQKTPTSQWTVTGSGAFVITEGKAEKIKIREACPGRVIDKGVTDPNNMGAAMAPAVCDTLTRYFNESMTSANDFDLILTGDLGIEGSQILDELMAAENYPLESKHQDCGVLMFDREKQDTHSGGSGCGCAASVLSGKILPDMEKGLLHKVLFLATGALMNPDSIKQGESIPSIAHLLYFEKI